MKTISGYYLDKATKGIYFVEYSNKHRQYRLSGINRQANCESVLLDKKSIEYVISNKIKMLYVYGELLEPNSNKPGNFFEKSKHLGNVIIGKIGKNEHFSFDYFIKECRKQGIKPVDTYILNNQEVIPASGGLFEWFD